MCSDAMLENKLKGLDLLEEIGKLELTKTRLARRHTLIHQQECHVDRDDKVARANLAVETAKIDLAMARCDARLAEVEQQFSQMTEELMRLIIDEAEASEPDFFGGGMRSRSDGPGLDFLIGALAQSGLGSRRGRRSGDFAAAGADVPTGQYL